ARPCRAARGRAALPLRLARGHQQPLVLRAEPDSGGAEPVPVTLNTPPIDWFGLSPVLTLIGTGFAALLCAVLVPRVARRLAAAGISIAGFTAGIVLAVWLYVDTPDGHTIAAGAYYRDRWTSLGQVIIFAVGLATTLLAVEHVPGWGGGTGAGDRRDDHGAEVFALLLRSGAREGVF